MRKLIIILAGILALFVFIRDIKVTEGTETKPSYQSAEISLPTR